MPTRPRPAAIVALATLTLCAPALAQEATNTPAATQPAKGKLYLRQTLKYTDGATNPDGDSRDTDNLIARTALTLGLTRNISASLYVPVHAEWTEDRTGDDNFGLGLHDISLSFKYRPFQKDLNPVDSVRFAVVGGIEMPSGDDTFSSDSWDPFLGGIFTAILGRHGINQSLTYKFNTDNDDTLSSAGDGSADALFFDTAYLYRLSPETYAADTTAATYLTMELNGIYETNGDTEILLGPGLLYEAQTFALEAQVGLPVYQDVDNRYERNLVVTLGFRILF